MQSTVVSTRGTPAAEHPARRGSDPVIAVVGPPDRTDKSPMKMLIVLCICWTAILTHHAVADMTSNIVSAINNSNAVAIADSFVVESGITEEQAKLFIGKVQAMYGPLTVATNEVRSGLIRRSLSLGKDHPGPIVKHEIAISCPKMDDAALILDLPIGTTRISMVEIAGKAK